MAIKTKFHDWSGVSPVTTFFMINMTFFLYLVLVFHSVALLQGGFNEIFNKKDFLWNNNDKISE